MKLAGQGGIVTGAGRGIGRGIALALAAEGMRVALVARTVNQIGETQRLIEGQGGTALALPADVTDAASVTKAARRTLDAFGQIDLLVANAGSFGAIGPVWEVDPDRWWTDVTTNVRGTFLSCRAVLPAMIARGQGTIVTLRGGGWDRPFRHGSGYASSKAAIVRFTDTLAAEVAPHGIGVYSLGPGLVRTAMTEIQLQSPEGRRWFGRAQEWFARGDDVPPSEAARVAVFLASLPHTKLSGRVIGTNDDLDWIATHVDDIVAEDLLVLRGRRPPG